MIMRQRRFLPSTSLLLALEAVVRRGSVTAAASELNLTQSTVSRLILTLEEQLDRKLFTRDRRCLIPSSAVLTYQREVSRALNIIQQASMSLVANPEGGTLALAVPPTFAARWLGLRLGRFVNDNPGILVNVATRVGRIDFDREVFDAAIYCGMDNWDGVNYLKLFDEKVTACGSPSFVEKHRLERLEDLERVPMLQLDSLPNAWADWFRGQGAKPVTTTGMLMDQFSIMIQAAIAGLGIALLPDYLAQSEISEGCLVPVFEQAVPLREAYWLVWPKRKENDVPLRVFRSWLERCC